MNLTAYMKQMRISSWREKTLLSNVVGGGVCRHEKQACPGQKAY